MEEISWGQRVLGYRPPVYFLEYNYQQELNLHNVVATDYRKLALQLIILIYGAVMPLLALLKPARRMFDRLGVIVSPAGLVPPRVPGRAGTARRCCVLFAAGAASRSGWS